MRKLENLRPHEIDFSDISRIYGSAQACYRHCKEETCDLGTEDIEHSLYDDDGNYEYGWTQDFFDRSCVEV